MGLRLVNLFPRSASDYTKPGQPLQMGLRATGIGGSGNVKLGTLRVALGYTSIHNEGLLPEVSEGLKKMATVRLDTAELIRPQGLQVVRSIFGTGIKIDAPVANPEATIGVYSVKVPIETDAPIMGYFKFKTKTAWILATRNWYSTSNMTGMYLGLEHGSFNTSCILGLRNNGGGGSLMAGGPLSTFNSVRPGQREISAFNWASLPNNTEVEVWIYFNRIGYNTPFVPTNTPIVEIWTKRGVLDPLPVFQTQAIPFPVTSLGQFPNNPNTFTNYRTAPSDYATLYFGNVGTGSDSLELTDWALYPDFRVAVRDGESLGANVITPRPDGPVSYYASAGLPQDIVPAKWFPISDTDFLLPNAAPFFQPGYLKTPSSTVITKPAVKASGYQRVEPRLEALTDGAMIEAFLSGEQLVRLNDAFGAGLLVDDAVRLFQVTMLETATGRFTLGIVKDPTKLASLTLGYFTPSEDIDWRSLKLVRLVIDRLRARVSLFVDEKRYLNLDQTNPLQTVPASSSPVGGRVGFGHLIPAAVTGKVHVAFLTYLTRYQAWEIDEQTLPNASPVSMSHVTSGTGNATTLDPTTPPLSATHLTIFKKVNGTFNSKNYYTKSMSFDERAGVLVDFRAQVLSYASRTGETFSKNIWLGSGIQLFFGNKKLHLGFFDCGPYGRFIGIIPGSGTANDIITQTDLGKRFSYPVEWTDMSSYRLSYKGFDKIEVWVDNIPTGPVISIPWTNDTVGFDLPLDATLSSIAFGHFDQDPSSKTAWEYFRFGFSNGYDVAVKPKFDHHSYLFGGRSYIQSEFDE